MKTGSRFLALVLLVMLMVVLAGCNLGKTAPTNQDTNNTNDENSSPAENTSDNSDDDNEVSEVIEEETASESLCANLYIPVVEGAAWTYSASSSVGESYAFTDTISGASSAGYNLVSYFTDLAKTQTWTCTDEGLIALEYAGGGEASVTTSGLNADFETTEMNGVTIPNVILPGDSWAQSFIVTGTSVLEGGLTAETSGTVAIVWTALDYEEVSVPAGTFEAIKVGVKTSLDFTITMEGVSVPFAMSEEGAVWFVEGVGWVKNESTFTLLEMSGTSTMELTSYAIP